MKKILTAALVAAMALGLVACGGSKLVDGVYNGTGEGMGGEVPVMVTIDEGKIVDVTMMPHQETEGIYEQAEEKVIPQIIEKQGVKGVDTAAGATITSNAIIQAVEDALSQAK